MAVCARFRGSLLALGCICVGSAIPRVVIAQQQPAIVGSVVGRVSVDGTAPRERILVSLLLRGAPVNSTYTDSLGGFGFYNLLPDLYTVTVQDQHYLPVSEPAAIEDHTLNPVVHVNLALTPKARTNGGSQEPARPSGANPDMADAREYSSRFPKDARKEFEKGVQDDRNGKAGNAIRHYEKAIAIAPEFYPAHNNLGSDYLSRSDFAAARKEFEQVIRLNQSDAAAYFNLSNLCMLTGDLAEADEYLSEGMRRQPESAWGHFLIGSIDLREGKYDQAEAALRQTIQINPTMQQAHLQLVNVLLQRHKNEEALAELRSFVTAFPDSSFTPKAKQLIEKLETVPPPSAAK